MKLFGLIGQVQAESEGTTQEPCAAGAGGVGNARAGGGAGGEVGGGGCRGGDEEFVG